MCLSCGCQDPDNPHGNYESFTVQKLFDAANAHGLDAGDVVNNIENTYALKVAGQTFHDMDLFDDDDDES